MGRQEQTSSLRSASRPIHSEKEQHSQKGTDSPEQGYYALETKEGVLSLPSRSSVVLSERREVIDCEQENQGSYLDTPEEKSACPADVQEEAEEITFKSAIESIRVHSESESVG